MLSDYVQGKDVKSEIQGIASQLGPLFDEFARLARDLGIKRAIDYYTLFLRYAQGQSNVRSPSSHLLKPPLRHAPQPEQVSQWQVCEMLLSVHEHGNEPVSEYVARKHPNLAAPVASEEPKQATTEDVPSEIKWGTDIFFGMELASLK